MKKWILLGLLLLLPAAAKAQEETAQPAPQPTVEVVTQDDEAVIHYVAPGDTLFSIAAQYQTSVGELLWLNSLNENELLQIGQQLLIAGNPALPIGAAVVSAPQLLNDPRLPPVPKLHTVRQGESLAAIAENYAVAVADLATTNQIEPDADLRNGQRLVIPAVAGELIERDYIVAIGDTVRSIASRFNTLPQHVVAQSGLLNPERLVAGQPLRLISRTGTAEPQLATGITHVVAPSETVTTIAAAHNVPPQTLARLNGIDFPVDVVFAGQRLRIPAEATYFDLPANLRRLAVNPRQLRQGESFTIRIEAAEPLTPTGRLQFNDLITATESYYIDDYQQAFDFTPIDGGYLAVVGVDAFAQPGIYELELDVDGDAVADFRQPLPLLAVQYGIQQIPLADDPVLRAEEDQQLAAIFSDSTPQPLWSFDSRFEAPLDNAFRSAGFGAARSYGGAEIGIYHSGIDFAAPFNTPVLAAAAGVVRYSTFTGLRGNVVIIDHGLGVMTGYYHLETRLVQLDDAVTAGQVIGSLGNTGLSTGAHLHWDLRVNNVPVNGAQWLQTIFPFGE